MNKKTFVILFAAILAFGPAALAENVDPYDSNSQYAWGENVGWVNFEPNAADPNAGAQVSSEKLTGFIWAENIGWINLDPNDADPNTGITNDGAGHLSGYAWAENVGWINFDPQVSGDSNDYGVKIDSNGNFYGWAWGENIGWINFGIDDYYVAACKVKFEDLANFVDDWLETGPGLPADLYSDESIDFKDYNILADYWLDYCPDGWPLK
jgi:hypothetical protein